MAETKRGLTIHSPTIMDAGIAAVVDDIMQSIERECSDMIFESDEAATADLLKNLEEQIKVALHFPTLRNNMERMIDCESLPVDFRLSRVIRIANTYRAWLAIRDKGVESFDAKAGKDEQ